MERTNKLPELPKLPKGEGTLRYAHGNKILHRKAIPVDNGYKRLAVTGNNIKECFDTMRRKEEDLRAGLKSAGSESLATAIDRWLDLYKQPEVKPSSYDRLRITYKAQITKMTIADKPWKLITAENLQAAINALVQDGYAWSTVKKAYDMLNAFYTFQTKRGNLPRSPMDICRMPLRENMLKQDKEIVYMTEPQIKVFCKEALSYAEGSSQLKYRYGPAFVFLIYTGLRIGELCALQCDLPLLEHGSRCRARAGQAGCRGLADHACAGQQHGVPAALQGYCRKVRLDRPAAGTDDFHELYPINHEKPDNENFVGCSYDALPDAAHVLFSHWGTGA